MAIKNYAAIDIGSNAVRLLIKRVFPGYKDGIDKLSKVLLLRVPLRLGFDVFGEGKISSEKADRMRRLMKAYRQLMKIYGVEHYRACATSAMRDAVNGMDIIKMIKKNTGIKIEIIDGQEEAQIVYNNHLECQEDRNGNYMYVDVGGGSTEINLLVNGKLTHPAGIPRQDEVIYDGKVWWLDDDQMTLIPKEEKEPWWVPYHTYHELGPVAGAEPVAFAQEYPS